MEICFVGCSFFEQEQEQEQKCHNIRIPSGFHARIIGLLRYLSDEVMRCRPATNQHES